MIMTRMNDGVLERRYPRLTSERAQQYQVGAAVAGISKAFSSFVSSERVQALLHRWRQGCTVRVGTLEPILCLHYSVQ